MNEDQLKTLVECEQRSKSNTKRIDRLEENYDVLNKLTTSVEVMANNMDTMSKSLDQVNARLTEQESKPGKRWEAVVEKIIFLVIGAVVAYIFARIGLS